MARSLLRRPGVLMAAYVVIFAWAGPWLSTGPAADRNLIELGLAVVLAIFAAHGSRAARVLIVAYSAVACFLMLFGTTQGWSPPLPRLWHMVSYVAQIALVVSTPMYQRSRRGWTPGPPAGPWLPAPRVWALLVSAAGGLGITLLHLGNLRSIPCPAHVRVLAHTPCLAGGTGMPFAYDWWGGYVQIAAHGNFRFLFVAAPRGVQVAAFATDWAMWGLGILLVLYLAGLNHSREYSALSQRPAADPAPAGP
jgi:hypothetical protein